MANLLRVNLLKLILIAALTALTLWSCHSLFFKNPATQTRSPDNTIIPPVTNIIPQDSQPERLPDAPYLQTPDAAVIKMLEMAQVKANDVVYDLGSGNGKIVIAAAQKFGAKEIGIEIDPELIRESNRELKAAIAKTHEISDRIQFMKQDFFKSDLHDATVITLYLLPQANLRVRSEILPKLKSGTRIVSYEYDLGDLAPKQIQTIKIDNQEHSIYLWNLD